MFCPKCGEPLATNAAFCTNCGKDVSYIVDAHEAQITDAADAVYDEEALYSAGDPAPATTILDPVSNPVPVDWDAGSYMGSQQTTVMDTGYRPAHAAPAAARPAPVPAQPVPRPAQPIPVRPPTPIPAAGLQQQAAYREDRSRGTSVAVGVVALVIGVVAIVVAAVLLINALTHPVRTVTYETGGGTVLAAVQVEDGKTLAAPVDPTRGGFKFDGWYLDQACTQPAVMPITVNGDITLYAKWVEAPAAQEIGAQSAQGYTLTN